MDQACDSKSVSKEELEFLRANDDLVQLNESSQVRILNSYYLANIPGSHKHVYVRKSVKKRLMQVVEHLGDDYQVVVYDGFRSLKTQLHLFSQFYHDIKHQKPELTESELLIKTKKYVSDPHDTKSKSIPPHNTGGAIDLTLYKLGQPLVMGSQFDEVSPMSQSDYFKQPWNKDLGLSEAFWEKAKTNRELLIGTMKQFGFTNYPMEWWHFDLGTCFWAKEFNSSWSYSSAEKTFHNMVVAQKFINNAGPKKSAYFTEG